MPTRITVTLVLCLLVCATSRAAAQEEATRTEARDLGAAGIDDFEAGRFAEAADKLDRAYHLFPVPTLGLWSARARAQLGRLVEGAERYRETSALPATVGDNPLQTEAKQDAASELAQLTPRIPSVSCALRNATAAEVRVTLDGTALSTEQLTTGVLANPGPHTLVAVRGHERVEVAVQLTEAEKRSVVLELEARVRVRVPVQPQPRAASPSAARVLGVAAIVVGGLGLATSGVGALVADAKLEPCAVMNGWHTCQMQGQLDAYNAAKTVSTVAFWGGAAVALIGISAVLASSADSEPAVSLALGPGSATVRGRF